MERVRRSPTDPGGPLDELFEQLSNPVRRRILIELAESASSETFDLETFVAGAESPERERIALHHVHLPKLAAADYVEWDRRSGTVVRGSRFEAIAAALDLLRAHADRLPGSLP